MSIASGLRKGPVADSVGFPQLYQSYLDKATPYTTYRWIGTAALLSLFFVRILLAQGWYIGTLASHPQNCSGFNIIPYP